ncbi:MAG: cation diffusion facilitator family transporter [Firmicutes bacterium]|nr:cation diffusion facilitator family transporter [Bacillota bacterium]
MDVREKTKVARLSIISNTILTAGKLVVGLSINSIGIISEAIHSGLDLMAAIIAYASIRESNKPADDRHQYGHGKFENLAAIIEALLIFAAALLIIREAVPKLYTAHKVESLGLGMVIMGVSAAANLYVSSRLMRVAKQTDSPALAADAWHLRTDVITSLGVLVGIVAIKLTGLYIIDPIIAILVALMIVKAAFDLLRESVGSILDVRLPDEDEKAIKEVLQKYDGLCVDYRNLRTRKAGPEKHLDFNLVVPQDKQIVSIHALCDQIESDLRIRIPSLHVIIHPEPCMPEKEDCDLCHIRLTYRQKNCAGKNCGICLDCCPEHEKNAPGAE